MSTPAITVQRKPPFAWLWLCYSGFLFIAPIFEPSLKLWLATLAVFAAFLVVFTLYVRSNDSADADTDRRHSRLRFWLIGATFLLGLIAFPWNPGASTFFVYAASFLPFNIDSIRRVALLFAFEALCVIAEGYTFHVFPANTLIAVFLLLIIGTGNIFFAQQKRAECKLRAAQEENVALAALAERERIARDLHDVLGHTLSVIVLKAELAGRLLTSETARNPQRAAAEIAEVERTARTALAEVREAIGGYRARGLLAEIEAARRTLDAAGVTLQCDAMPATATGLRANEETVLALALREAVTNIVRHARASTCTLRFTIEAGQHRLLVEDNGEHPHPREGNGLRGMRERVEALGGRVSVDRNPGTRLLIALPTRPG